MQIEASQMNFAAGIELSFEALPDKVVDPMKNCLMTIQKFNEVKIDVSRFKGEAIILGQI
jgi:predicted Zn-dependent protease with MMP-like domain